MQNYEKQPKDENLGKKIILEFLDYLRYKVENDRLTLEEMESIAHVIDESLNLTGTAEDFCKFYGQTPTNVHAVISRKLLARPRRSVTYPFQSFRRVVPRTWKKSNGGG